MQKDWKPWAAILLLLMGLTAVAAGRAGWLSVVGKFPASAPNTVPAELGRPPSPVPVSLPASLTLHGDVLPPSNQFTLTVHVGNVVSQSTVSGPSYVVNIAGNSPDDMVSIEVEGQGFYYASLLGSYGRLARRSGADGVLTVPELDRLRISPISTALYFFTKRALAGRLPASDQEHERVIASLDGFEVGRAATALDLLGRGVLALPSGYANGYGLLSDQAGFSRFVLSSPDSALYKEYVAYMAVAPADGISTDRISQNMLMSGPHTLNDVSLSLYQDTQVMSQTSAGTELYASDSRRNPAFSTNYPADGSLQLTPRSEISTNSIGPCDFEACLGAGQASRRSVLQGETYRQLFTGDKYNLWVGLSKGLVTFPDYPNEPARVVTEARAWAVSNLDTMAAGFSTAEMLGPRALPTFCEQGTPVQLSDFCEFALHQFQAGGTGSTVDVGPKVDNQMLPATGTAGEAFSWSVTGVAKPGSPQSGKLRITTATTSTTYWRVAMPDAATSSLVYVVRASDGADTLTLAGQTTMIDARTPVGFADIGPVGTWRYATFEQQRWPYVYDAANGEAPSTTTRFIRSADGTELRQNFQTDNPSNVYYKKSGWQLAGGRLYDTRYKSNGTPAPVGYYSCADAYAQGATLCAPREVRYFRPLTAVGNRLYGIEEMHVNTSSSYTPPYSLFIYSRPTYYEKLAP